jgi:hypothetical protein
MLGHTYLSVKPIFFLFRLTETPRWNGRRRGRARLIASNSAAMASTSKPKPSRVKVREHRERLRGQGLHPIQNLGAGRARTVLPVRGATPIAGRGGDARTREDPAFIDAVSDWENE